MKKNYKKLKCIRFKLGLLVIHVNELNFIVFAYLEQTVHYS